MKVSSKYDTKGSRPETVGTYHDVDLLLDLGEHTLVRDGDALENMVCSIVDGGRGADEVDVGEAT